MAHISCESVVFVYKGHIYNRPNNNQANLNALIFIQAKDILKFSPWKLLNKILLY